MKKRKYVFFKDSIDNLLKEASVEVFFALEDYLIPMNTEQKIQIQSDIKVVLGKHLILQHE